MTEQSNLTQEQAVAAGIQSPNWERYNHYEFTQGEWIEEGNGEFLPNQNLGENRQQQYDLIGRGGQRLIGKPRYSSDSPFDSSYNNGWNVAEESAKGKRVLKYAEFAIIAWKQHEE